MGEREHGIKFYLHKCAVKYDNPAILDIPFECGDRGNVDKNNIKYVMCYDKNDPLLEPYCGVDWCFCHWPSASIHSFEETKQQIITESSKEPTIDKVGWYGNIFSPLDDVPEYHTRPLLKRIGDENPDIFDIVHILPQQSIIDNKIPNYLSLPDLIRYKYLIDIGGNGYSGRLKWLLFSGRPLIIVDRVYVEYFHKDLIPYKHYIPVNMDLSDLLEKVEWMKNNNEQCLIMAKNAFEFATSNFTEEKLIERAYYAYNNVSNYLKTK
jgi:hypothetical protein